jgi:Arginyl-tRNA synthetase
MNIFEIYLEKIIKLLKKLQKEGLIEIPDTLDGINVDIPPVKFNADISSNVAMVLSKINKKSPIDIANQLLPIIKKNDDNIDSITIEKPGFINIKFKVLFWNNFLQ